MDTKAKINIWHSLKKRGRETETRSFFSHGSLLARVKHSHVSWNQFENKFELNQFLHLVRHWIMQARLGASGLAWKPLIETLTACWGDERSGSDSSFARLLCITAHFGEHCLFPRGRERRVSPNHSAHSSIRREAPRIRAATNLNQVQA